MRITIEPSSKEPSYINEPSYIKLTGDTLTNDESTPDAVELALNLIVAYGHSKQNVVKYALSWAEENE